MGQAGKTLVSDHSQGSLAMLKALFLLSSAMAAQAFMLTPSSSLSSSSDRLPKMVDRSSSRNPRFSSLSLKAHQDPECRRKFMRNIAAAGMPFLLLDLSQEVHAYSFDVKEGDKARQDYLEDVASMKKARWNRQVCCSKCFRVANDLSSQRA
eukprot:745755-Hanusia_phi.AAC.3